MWTTRSKIVFILYRITAAWLPISQRSRLGKGLRVFWARKMIRCGNAVNIERNAYFTPGLSLGDHSGIGIDCEVYGPVTIGKNVMMGPEVVIYTVGHRFDRIDIPMIEQGSTDAEPVTIGDDMRIGRRV